MRIRMLRSTTRTAPVNSSTTNNLVGSLAIGVNRSKTSESLFPMLSFGTGSAASQTNWKPVGPVLMGTNTLIPTLTPDTFPGNSKVGLMRYVPPTNTNYPRFNSQPGLQVNNGSDWLSLAPYLFGATYDGSGDFSKSIRYGANNLLNYTQGSTISIGNGIGYGNGSAEVTSALSSNAPPGSIYITPNGVPRTPNAVGITRNTLVGNYVWAADAPITGIVTSGGPIYNSGTCRDVTVIGSYAAQAWGQNQVANKSININTSTVIGYKAAQYNCGAPTSGTGVFSLPANNIAIGSQALQGLQTVRESYPVFPGGENIAIGSKCLFLNQYYDRTFYGEWVQEATSCTLIGNDIFTTMPDPSSQEAIINGRVIGLGKGNMIIGIGAANRLWSRNNCFQIVFANRKDKSVKGDLTTSIGDIFGGEREIWSLTDDIPVFTKRGVFIGKNTSNVFSQDQTGVICLGYFGMSLGSGGIGFGTNNKKLFSVTPGCGLEPFDTSLQGSGGAVYVSGGQNAKTTVTPAASAMGGVDGNFKIITGGVSKTYTVRNGVITQIQ